MKSRLLPLAALLLCPLFAFAQSVSDFEKRVTEFTLGNGLHFIIFERHEAPVVSFHSYVNAGSVDDPSGETGIAHMFEHMAFKGTETIGTKDYPLERKAMDEVEHVYDQYEAERNKGSRSDPKKRHEQCGGDDPNHFSFLPKCRPIHVGVSLQPESDTSKKRAAR